MAVLVAVSIGLSACSGGGGGGSSTPEASVSTPENRATDIVINPPAAVSQTASQNTPQATQSTTTTTTTTPVQEPEVALTDMNFEVSGGSARKIGLHVTPVPAEAELPGFGFSWDPAGAGRMTYADTIQGISIFLFRCAEGFYGDVVITMSNSNDSIVKTVTATCG